MARWCEGTIRFRGDSIVDTDAAGLVCRGIVQVLEGRRCFAHLTVEENILAGGFVNRPSRRVLADDLERVYTWFPRLKQRRRQPAGLNSGGEQQMIAIGRALMTLPQSGAAGRAIDGTLRRCWSRRYSKSSAV